MKKNKKANIFLWLGIVFGILGTFIYVLSRSKSRIEQLNDRNTNKYVKIIDGTDEHPMPEVKMTIENKEIIKGDLKVIKGIGPAIERLLNENNILTFEDLRNSSVDDLRTFLARKNLRLVDPQTWPSQADQFLIK